MSANAENPGLERTRRQLRASGVKDTGQNPHRSGVHTRGYLPHVKREGAEYFVTFRLADSLPAEILMRYESQRAQRLRLLEDSRRFQRANTETADTVEREFRRNIERYLDQGAGACHLRRPEVASLVAGALSFFNGTRYQLREWVVMPNHVHVLVWPNPNHLIGDIVKSWKQFTSTHAKRLLGLEEGRFWQPEAYDHWIRNDKERAQIARYIRNNPVTGGLCPQAEAWPWGIASRQPPQDAVPSWMAGRFCPGGQLGRSVAARLGRYRSALAGWKPATQQAGKPALHRATGRPAPSPPTAPAPRRARRRPPRADAPPPSLNQTPDRRRGRWPRRRRCG